MISLEGPKCDIELTHWGYPNWPAFRCLRNVNKLKGLRPLPSTPADSRIFGFFDFSENVDFWNFPVGFKVWEGLQWIGDGCGIKIDGFSAQTEPYGSISADVHDFDHFGTVSGGLTLFPEGPRTVRDCPEGPGTLSEGPGTLSEGPWDRVRNVL